MEAYFDNSATTRCFEEVKDIVVKTMMEDFGNWKETEPNHFNILVKFISEIDLKEKLIMFNVIMENSKIVESYGLLENGNKI